MNDEVEYFRLYRKVTLFLFSAAIFSATMQGGAISIFALLNNLPTSPQKYDEEVEGFGAFYFFSVAKHMFLATSVAVALFYIFDKNKKNSQWGKVELNSLFGIYPLIFLAIILPMLSISFFSDGGWLLVLLGAKAAFPLLAVVVGFCLDRSSVNFLAKFMDLLIYVNLFIAILQQIMGFMVCEAYTYGCSSIFRSTGLFVEPNTLGVLAVSRVLLMGFEDSKKNLPSLIAAISLLILSGSRTMAIVFFLAFVLQFWRGMKELIWIGALLIPPLGYLLFSRGIESLLERLSNFRNISIEKLWFGGGFGYGTQAHHFISRLGYNVVLPPDADSQILSLINQGGLWLLFCLAALSAWFYFNINKKFSSLILLVFWLSATTFMTLEAWPLNILIFALIGYALKLRTAGEALWYEKCN